MISHLAEVIGRSRRLSASLLCAVALVGSVVLVAVTASAPEAGATPPPTPDFGGRPVEDYAVKGGGPRCVMPDPHRKGTEALRSLLKSAYPDSTGSIYSGCHGHTSDSDHHTGRALDWYPQKGTAGQEPSDRVRRDGDQVVAWLLEDVDGVAHMRLRRLGIYYIIWQNRIWEASTGRWQKYNGCPEKGGTVGCHRDHVHLSLGSAGADGQSSWWTGQPPNDGKPEPTAKPTPSAPTGRPVAPDARLGLLWYEKQNPGAGGDARGVIREFRRSEGRTTTREVANNIAEPQWAGVGDFDHNGYDDLAWYEAEQDPDKDGRRGTIYGMFRSAEGLTTRQLANNIGGPSWAGVGDFDGNGFADIAWYEAELDPDKDGRRGIVSGLFGGSDGMSLRPIANNIGGSDWAGVGDFDGNGLDDIAWYEAWQDPDRDGRKGRINGIFGTPQGSSLREIANNVAVPQWAGGGDFDHNGFDDLAWYEAELDPDRDGRRGVMHGLFRSEKGTATRQIANNIGGPDWAGVGDFDGDGFADIAWYEAWQDPDRDGRKGRINGIFVTPEGSSLREIANNVGSPDWAGPGSFARTNGNGQPTRD